MDNPPPPLDLRALRRNPPAMAALDLGTNNCRLLVARPTATGFRGGRQLLAHRPPGRGGREQRPAQRAGDRAHGRGAAGLRPHHRAATTSAGCAASRPRPAAAPATASSSSSGSSGSPGSRSRSCRTRRRRCSRCSAACRWSIPRPSTCCWSTSAAAARKCLWLDRGRAAARLLRCVSSLPIGVVALSEAFALEPDAPCSRRWCAGCRRLLVPIEASQGSGAARGRAEPDDRHLGTVTTLAALHLDLRATTAGGSTARCSTRWRSPRRLDAAARHEQCGARGASLHRAGPRRPRGRRLRDPRGGAAQLADRPPAGRRPRPARGHPARADGALARPGAARDPRRRRRAAGGATACVAAISEPWRRSRPSKVRLQARKGRAGELEPLARAPPQRPLRAERARRGLPLAGGLQAARARPEVRAAAAGPAGARPRQRARAAGCRSRPPPAAAWSASICSRWRQSLAARSCRATSSSRRRASACARSPAGRRRWC